MKYMLLLYGEGDAGPAPGSSEFTEMLNEYVTATEAMRSAGVLLDSSPLQPVTTATTLRVRDGARQVTDRPFAEIKEMLGGYYLIESPDFDDALRWAASIPAARYGSIEVRPLMVMGGRRAPRRRRPEPNPRRHARGDSGTRPSGSAKFCMSRMERGMAAGSARRT